MRPEHQSDSVIGRSITHKTSLTGISSKSICRAISSGSGTRTGQKLFLTFTMPGAMSPLQVREQPESAQRIRSGTEVTTTIQRPAFTICTQDTIIRNGADLSRLTVLKR